ncbi:MAG TPA: 16S rRNA (guanine(966)-N(2))-methyltransferase RsmD [Streptosporangiaceae bacterium]
MCGLDTVHSRAHRAAREDERVRVIAGVAKGRRLRPPPAGGTRPITDRAKESLFNILAPRIAGRSFLDLFAGTGSVGIEALSRGAGRATFVERSARAAANIHHNLAITGQAGQAEVVTRDVFGYLREPPTPFDVIFMAPPQWRGLWPKAVALLDREPGWLAGGGLVVVQHDPAESTELGTHRLRVCDERSYARVRFTFLSGRAAPDDPR